jgi:Na+/proline symporter
MLAAVISAILSTVSSQLLVAASAVSYDVVEGVVGRHPDDRRSLVLGRWTVAAVGFLGVLLALSEVRLVFWFVLFAWSILGAAFGPLILLAIRPNGVNRHGALACMLVGLGVSVAWKLGRGLDDNPEAFGLVPWVTLAVAALILIGGWLGGKVRRGETIVVIVATVVTLTSWGVVQQGAFRQLYELVPAFVLAAIAAVAVSRFVPVRD